MLLPTSVLYPLVLLVAFHHRFHVLASPESRGRGPNFRGRDICPTRCSQTGPAPDDWPVYKDLDQLRKCPDAIFYDFSLFAPVDEPGQKNRLYACSAGDGSWSHAKDYSRQVKPEFASSQANVSYEIGWWPSSQPAGLQKKGKKTTLASIRALSQQMRQYMTEGHAPTDRPFLRFAKFGKTTLGIYVGQALQNEGTGEAALMAFEESLAVEPSGNSALLDGASAGDGVAMQLCNPGDDATRMFAIMASTNDTFGSIQRAMESLSQAKCLSGFAGSTNVTAEAYFVTPLPFTDFSAEASAELFRCGVSEKDFMKYNTRKDLCPSLQPLEHVCCSAGDMPDFRPKPHSDGSCDTYKVGNNDYCASIAAAKSLTVKELESFNKKTWGWNGCERLWSGTIICVSKGDAPMPAPLANAICGPQGVKIDLAKLNQCDLNACCDVWGQCGTTDDFCTDTSSDNPGTAEPGTNGCISNCGTDIWRTGGGESRSIAYFEGYNSDSNRACLWMDARQIDTAKYTHVHFGFATLTEDFQVDVGGILSQYQFETFKNIRGTKRILTFGGWEFSTSPKTYHIFRNAVTSANRVTTAKNIANFVKDNNLNGVDIDWEYPGAPDIPGIPAGSKDEGDNYLAFLVVLRNLLGSTRSISIAAASSYWYLKAFPIAEISDVVDYIVFMTYDLHGQWDSDSKWSNPGCANGNCLRSQVNLTETLTALSMITKADVPSNKVVVGITSYGRSFEMSTPGCTTEECTFTGGVANSNAAKGMCTGTAGYISEFEINEIIRDGSRVTKQYVDEGSHTNVLVYDDIQWVGYMDGETKAARKRMYEGFSMGGTSDWAVDLQTDQPPPAGTKSWAIFFERGRAGDWIEGDRTGNWTQNSCHSEGVKNTTLTPSERWSMLDCQSAWEDAVKVWKTIHRPEQLRPFSQSIAHTFGLPEGSACQSLFDATSCDSTVLCVDEEGTGAGGTLVWNSLVTIHATYKNYYTALKDAFSILQSGFKAFQNDFTPLPDNDDEYLNFMLDLINYVGIIGASAPNEFAFGHFEIYNIG
ncbi:Glycoside hydrolase [Apiospora sp. TS-2023a]